MTRIEENYHQIMENIAAAARVSGQNPEDITLVGVTKTVEAARIQAFLQAGGRILGENKAQELLAKRDDPVLAAAKWHFIGHLQTNKVRQIIDKVTMIQSVDSLRLAEEIDRQAKNAACRMDVLIEINIAGEQSKQGFSPESIERDFGSLLKLSNIRVRGLMCMPPFVENIEENIEKSVEKNKHLYTKFMNISVDIKRAFGDNYVQFLSMGTSQDYTFGVSVGINMVRIGTALFGTR